MGDRLFTQDAHQKNMEGNKEILNHIDKSRQKKDVWKVRRKFLPALLLSVVPSGIQKRVEHSVRRVSGDCSLREGRRFNC